MSARVAKEETMNFSRSVSQRARTRDYVQSPPKSSPGAGASSHAPFQRRRNEWAGNVKKAFIGRAGALPLLSKVCNKGSFGSHSGRSSESEPGVVERVEEGAIVADSGSLPYFSSHRSTWRWFLSLRLSRMLRSASQLAPDWTR